LAPLTASTICLQIHCDRIYAPHGLFKLHDIPYQPPYRKGTVEETDGFFTFRGFDYLLEARWRKTQPPIGDLRAFSGKVKAKIESTRGLFLSIPGFRKEVVDEAATLSNLIP